MLKNITKNRSKSASVSTSINNSPGCFSESSSTSFSSKVYLQSPDRCKEKNKLCDDIDADSESEEIINKPTKKSQKKSKNLKKASNTKSDPKESLFGKSTVENHLEPPLEATLNSAELKSEILSPNERSKPDTNVDTSYQRVTRKRKSIRNIETNKLNATNNNTTEKVPDKVHPKLNSSKLEKIVKNLENKAVNKDDEQISDCDKDEENGEIPLDLRLQALSNKRASKESESKKMQELETVPPLFIILNNDKPKKPKKSSKNVNEKVDENSIFLDSKSQESVKSAKNSTSQKESEEDETFPSEKSDLEPLKGTMLTRKPLRKKHFKEVEGLSSNSNEGVSELSSSIKRKRLGSRRKSKKDSTEEHDKETAIKKSCMVRKALYKLKEKFQLDDEDEEDSNTTERENESDTNQEGEDENIDKSDYAILEKKTGTVHKTVLRTKIPLEEINDDTLIHKISDDEDMDEKRKKNKLFHRNSRTRTQDDADDTDTNENNDEKQSKDFTNFSGLKNYRASPRKVKSALNNDLSSNDIPNISLESNDSTPSNTPPKVSLKRGRPKKVNSTLSSVCSDDIVMSDTGTINKINTDGDNDTMSISPFNLEITEDKCVSGDEAPEGLMKLKHFVKNIPKKRKTIKNMLISADTDKDSTSPPHDINLSEGLNGIVRVSIFYES